MTVESNKSTWLESALAPLSEVRLAVLGDFCLDGYWIMDTDQTEYSIETALPVRKVRQQRYSLGGAGNVVANLTALGVGRVQAIGVVGDDFFGRELLRLLAECGADFQDCMIVDASWQTMVYAKPYARDREESRIDFGAFNVLTNSIVEALIGALDKAAAENTAVVLNQQIPRGIGSTEIVERINAIIAKYPGTQFVVDARHRPDLYRGAVLKLNSHEAARFLGDSTEEYLSAGKVRGFAARISQKTKKSVFLTRGEHGILVADGNEVHEIPGIQVSEAVDPVGAGDTVVSAIAAMLGSGQQPVLAAKIANISASVTVRKLRTTGTATRVEILAAGQEPDYIFEPELARTPQRAVYLDGTEIERIGELPADLEIRHCIFDHDGTLSTLREGWERIMEPMMVRAVLGAHYDDADVSVLERITREVHSFIDRTTGIQTLVQMRGLVKLVRQAGFVSSAEILDEHAYKEIFNQELLQMVSRRTKKLARGELDRADFQIKNATRFLRELHQRGIQLYLASGTDVADVIAEAEAMGYADLFEGRIFGAVGDVNIEAKKIVMDRIIEENGLSGRHFATVGDGPVEIRETRKRGGLCIGVASDEVRRFGLNPVKRTRLIRAGAMLVTPDYSQTDALLGAMGIT